MPRGRWKKCFYANDPFSKVIKIKTDGRKELQYYRELSRLITLIVKHITPIINYNHVITTYPKWKLPLRFEGNHMDISYLTEDSTLCFIQFHIIPARRLNKTFRKLLL